MDTHHGPYMYADRGGSKVGTLTPAIQAGRLVYSASDFAAGSGVSKAGVARTAMLITVVATPAATRAVQLITLVSKAS